MAAVQLSRHVCFTNWFQATLHGPKPALLKAAGMKMRGASQHAVLDLTAGLCKDAAVLASHGAHVVAVERHPAVFECVHSALVKVGDKELTRTNNHGKLTVYHADSRHLLKALHDANWTPPATVAGEPESPSDAFDHIVADVVRILADNSSSAVYRYRTLYIDPMHQPRRKKSALVKQVMFVPLDVVGATDASSSSSNNVLWLNESSTSTSWK